MYGHQATEYSKKLNIALAERVSSSKSNPGKIEMIKFNQHQAKKYIYILAMVLRKSIAIIGRPSETSIEYNDTDTLEDTSTSPKQKPRLLKIITPGTLTDESFLDNQKSNFLMCLYFPKYASTLHDGSNIGMAWVDVSVGSFFYESTTMADLASNVARINPSELVIQDFMSVKFQKAKTNSDLHQLEKNFLINFQSFPHADSFYNYIHMFEDFDDSKQHTNDDIHLEGCSHENNAVVGLLHYVKTHLPDTKTALRLPERKRDENIVKIDNISRASLELLKALRNNEISGTLYQSIKKTSSPSGTRLLVEWIKEPLLSIKLIKLRQKHVKELVQNPLLHSSLKELLKASNDPERILQSFSRGKRKVVDIHKMAQDLILFDKIKRTIENNPKLKKTSVLKQKVSNLVCLTNLWETIYKYIDSNPPTKETLFDTTSDMSLLAKHNESVSGMSLDKLYTNNYQGNETTNSLNLMTHQQLQKHILQKFDSWLINPNASETLKKYHQELLTLVSNKTKTVEKIAQKYESQGLKPTFKYEKLYGYFVQLRQSKGLAKNAQTINQGSIILDIDEFAKQNPDAVFRNGSGKTKSIYIYDDEWTQLSQKIDKTEARIRTEERNVLAMLGDMVSVLISVFYSKFSNL